MRKVVMRDERERERERERENWSNSETKSNIERRWRICTTMKSHIFLLL